MKIIKWKSVEDILGRKDIEKLRYLTNTLALLDGSLVKEQREWASLMWLKLSQEDKDNINAVMAIRQATAKFN